MGTWEFTVESGVILIRLSGEISVSDLHHLMPLMVDASKKYTSTKFLFDNTHSNLSLSTMEIYGLPREAEAQGLKRTWMFALVFPTPSRDSDFLEIMAKNTGYFAKTFRTVEDAMLWLREETE